MSALMGLVNFDLLTLKVVCKLHQRWGTFIPNLGTLGLRVLESFAMYAPDKSNAYCPLSYRRGVITYTLSRLQKQ